MFQGGLFPSEFLRTGVLETDAWRSVADEEVSRFQDRILRIFEAFPIDGRGVNEALTEQELIEPILAALGWDAFLPQQKAAMRGRADVPDYLLLVDQGAKTRALKRADQGDRYRDGVAVLEAKTWQRPLDRGAGPRGEIPSTQMLRYLSRVEVLSNRKIRWGILTNGRKWRLYFQGARSRAEEYLDLDLAACAGIQGIELDLFAPKEAERPHLLKLFYVLFRRGAFLPAADTNVTFHESALERGRRWQVLVSNKLTDVVFDQVYPELVNALYSNDRERPPGKPGRAYLDEVRQAALTILYRLLFVLYAEDRGLLPVDDDRYDDYSLRRIRDTVASRLDAGDAFSHRRAPLYRQVKELWALIDEGDDALHLPAYNGGLFDRPRHSMVERVDLPDVIFGSMLDALSRLKEGGPPRYINFRDLSVRELGSIYERLLEFEPILDRASNTLKVILNPFARKASGSYYTPDELVELIVERAVGPLVQERIANFFERAEELGHDHRPVQERLADLAREDAAEAILGLRICDPAMGSSHFLAAAVDFLADSLLEAVAAGEEAVPWAKEHRYDSPLGQRVEAIRERLRRKAREHGWRIDEAQLDDRQIIRRMILKRCVYGVDKNPMAVELAKVSLWLHTFTAGAPLSFLDHHLKCGDSLFGEFVCPVEQELAEGGALYINRYVVQARASAAGMAKIEEAADADIAEVKASASSYAAVDDATAPLRGFLDFWHGIRWLNLEPADRTAVHALLDGAFGPPVPIAAGTQEPIPPAGIEEAVLFPQDTARQGVLLGPRETSAATYARLKTLLGRVRAVVERERPLHWQAAFPGVWHRWESPDPAGGFDVVLGNPPWDRIKLQEVEWFAARRPQIAHATTAAERRRMVSDLMSSGDPLAEDYKVAKEAAEAAARIVRDNGQYPLLSSGDINIYALFVERARRLVNPGGIVALLVPSGIASDKNHATFFQLNVEKQRLMLFLDFFNKKYDGTLFFPYYRFKFCVFAVGGSKRSFPAVSYGCFLRDLGELERPHRVFHLSAADIRTVNPNTGTAPIFRTARDAEITTALYRQLPVLVYRRGGMTRTVWPVDYTTNLHMTNDSHLFQTRIDLKATGAYPVADNRLKKGPTTYLPLYEGKMVQAFDHRAANVAVDPNRMHRPGQPVPATSDQHSDPAWRPEPQFWVAATEVSWPEGLEWALALKDVTSTTNTRTVIASMIPMCAAGNTLPLIWPKLPPAPAPDGDQSAAMEWHRKCLDAVVAYRDWAPVLLSNLNSFALDYVARQKVQGQHLNWYIVEQFPVVPEPRFRVKIGRRSIGELVRQEVLALTYTGHDMAPFARDQGYEGAPFRWDEEDRFRRRARLDALFFLLYGLDADSVSYVLDQFPIVRRQEEQAFGRYRSKDLILGYLAAFRANDPDAVIAA